MRRSDRNAAFVLLPSDSHFINNPRRSRKEVTEQKLARLEEALWVSEAQAGDSDAFVRLLNRHEKPLLYYLRRLVPNADDALDLYQEVWLDAFRGLKSLQVPEA